MNTFYENTDATNIYHETSGLTAIRMDRTSDTGSLLDVMRDAVLILGPPCHEASQEKIPDNPRGTIDAYSRG
ncbi:hypothetical protein [Shinella granuli]|uniref:Uncharacterized protein n=1 Tax=Shinella granuli TaxID=323621 RepID=A0A4R2C875_SHIGR|nr:hypothetical protein [Shinella granuli]TCN34934.1 hypothetical protein EV665_13113 [Shinella granuli]